ncbi:MAG: hydrogenase maturation protease [Methylococcaceae bacterium]|jgi:hydrogenase maturation protease|nr:hydrogenase maturation protease [Methylococcaceae bacterium]MDD1636521.1 hydrogenase maturation protease [Methylococcaceae bacterium]MDD1642068.1 hydrogenase maturation protease [Methylococcaceae bacterium]OYV19871.1 MAG: hydrogenase maturation protease [Methylococcaceae bacterium NSM2-1]
MVKPVLVFGYGNLSRGDDALGPLLLEYVESHCNMESIEIQSDFQLQIEHALDLENRSIVLFVDASVSCVNKFDFAMLEPARDKSYTTHAMSPAAVLDVYQSIKKQRPPPCFLLSIKAEKFELGESLSTQAETNLERACLFAGRLLQNPDIKAWRQQANDMRQPLV